MIFKELLTALISIDLPGDEYIIVGSGPLAAREIRDAQDLDVLASDKLWSELSQKYPVTEEFSLKKISFEDKKIEILGEGSAFRDPEIATVQEMIETADVIEGRRFLNLDLLRKFKAKMGREKDLKDIELIDQYLVHNLKP